MKSVVLSTTETEYMALSSCERIEVHSSTTADNEHRSGIAHYSICG